MHSNHNIYSVLLSICALTVSNSWMNINIAVENNEASVTVIIVSCPTGLNDCYHIVSSCRFAFISPKNHDKQHVFQLSLCASVFVD